MYGKTHSENACDKIRYAITNRERVICPHCNIEFDLANAYKWHFDNCKKNPKSKRRLETCPHCGVSGTNNMKRYHFDNCKKK
jgi:hypothetical protein